MPPLGVLIGGVDFSKLQIVLKRAADGSVTAAIRYGAFINTLIEFIVIAFVIFLIIKWINSLKSKEEVPKAPPKPSEDIILLREIRDLLQKTK